MILRSHTFIAYILALSLLTGTCSVPALAASNEGEQNTSAQAVTEENTSSSDGSSSGDSSSGDSSSGDSSSGDSSSGDSSSGNDASGPENEGNGSSDSGNNDQGSGGQGGDQTGNSQEGSGEGQSGEFIPGEQGENGEFNPDSPNGDGLNQDGEYLDGENPDGENPEGEDPENGESGEGMDPDENSGEGQTQDGGDQDGDQNQNGDQGQNGGQGQGSGNGQNGSGEGQGEAQDPGTPRIDLSAAELSLESTSYSYDGTAPHPGVTVMLEGTALENGLDYNVIYDESYELGTHVLTVSGTGNYTGTIQAEYTIAKRKQTVSGKQSYTKRLGYDPFMIRVKTNGDGRLVYHSSNPKVISVSKRGKASVKGTGTAVISIYAEETEFCQKSNVLRVTVKVLKKQQKVTGTTSYTKSLGTDDFKITVTKEGNGKLIYMSSNRNVATVSASGKVTVKGVGAAKITVYAAETATCLQSTAKVITVKVGPEKTALTGITSGADYRTTIQWQQQENVSGYQIQYSDTPDFSKSKVVTAGATDTSKVISGMSDAAAYYVRVRAYQMQDGKRLFAEWSEPEEIGAQIQAASPYGNAPGSGAGISAGPSQASSVASGSHHRLLLRLLQLREKSSPR